MHRGSSKERTGADRRSERLPLSASRGSEIEVEIVFARAESRRVERATVPEGSTVRMLLRRLGHAPEGCAVFGGEESIPLDSPILGPTRMTVFSAFSGG